MNSMDAVDFFWKLVFYVGAGIAVFGLATALWKSMQPVIVSGNLWNMVIMVAGLVLMLLGTFYGDALE